MSTLIPPGVFWVYTTGRFHSITTRADMGDRFAAQWRDSADHFPVAWRADFLPEELHPAPRGGPFDEIFKARLRDIP